ncbi:MAG: zf-HC2 domain-containing protein [Clostridiales bacterium]|nr:zf-HC2 domain-containing protein [Clostridiales bacterium]
MNCKRAEKFLLLSFDGRLGEKDRAALDSHLQSCSLCREKEKEYRQIFSLLHVETPEPLPYFEDRLMAKLKEKEKSVPTLFWQRWTARAMAVSLAVAILFGAGALLFRPQEALELSQPEILLLHDENPLAEAATILEQKKPEDRNMMLIFAASEMRDPARRYRP